ncbi:MAG: FkbM family methyltransferase [Burkholderiales bacterium 68-12]|nr:FkbM family methyltransferase [Burkholderiales bacterium]OJX28519.1 MAG: FkbM family methyltransferase [Burkholderiales bacterium 68-12]
MSIDGFLRLREQAVARTVRRIDPGRPVWIFGAGNFGQVVARVLQARGTAVVGFVETIPRIRETQGLPVVDWPALARIDSKAQLVLGIFNRATPHDQLVAIATQAGFAPPLMAWEIYDQCAAALGWQFWLGERSVLVAHLERLAQVAERLADDESRQTLLRLCAFRLGLDLEYSSFLSADPQYFNALTLPPLQGKAITCIDCGAYDGDTFIELLRQPGIHCKQAFLLEPDPDNYARLVQRVAGQHTQAVCLPLAAADRYGVLSFASGQGEGCAIGEGDIRVAAAALDQIVPQGQVDFIKLDVEGAEALVLQGARRMIERCRPVLAVSLYHNPSDIWELPELLFSLCRDYRFYVRQHCCNSFDSVLYAVPDFE